MRLSPRGSRRATSSTTTRPSSPCAGGNPDVTRRSFVTWSLVILACGLAFRAVWLRADPPTTSVGIVWHDEGPWTHNARNKALWGQWVADQWNPVYVAPVFIALEYATFRELGVGTWQ